MRDHIGNYPHHSGHGVGTSYHEGPRITPYNDTILEPGMIIALEPAIYKQALWDQTGTPDAGYRIGSELLTKFKHRLEII